MNRIKFAKVAELPPGTSIEKRILARRIAVVNDNGTLYGIEAECKHMKAPLSTGEVKDGIITCSWHNWQYELKTGKCLTQKNMDLQKFEVEIDNDDIYLIIGG